MSPGDYSQWLKTESASIWTAMAGTKQKRLTETEPRSTVLRSKAEDTWNEGSEREVVPASEGEWRTASTHAGRVEDFLLAPKL